MSKVVYYTVPGTANTPEAWAEGFNEILGKPDALQPTLEALNAAETSRGMPEPYAFLNSDTINVLRITIEVVRRDDPEVKGIDRD